MSVIQEPGSTRPGRAAGLVLLGVAVIAVVLGVITLIDGDEPDNPAAPPSSSTQPPPNTSAPRPPSGSGQPPASPPPSTPTTANPPAPPATSQAPPPAQPPDLRRVAVRVFNNGTITGLAAQAARDFRGDGWNVVEVGNYSQGIIPTTTAYFRAGTEEEAAARELARKFSMRAEPRFAGIIGAQPGLIVMITNDYGGK